MIKKLYTYFIHNYNVGVCLEIIKKFIFYKKIDNFTFLNNQTMIK